MLTVSRCSTVPFAVRGVCALRAMCGKYARACVTCLHDSDDRRNADMICVVEDGKVVETGKHEELIRVRGGKYLQLVKLQLGGAVNPDG